jgi:hypothetical protein
VIIDRDSYVSHTNYNYIQLSKQFLSVAEHVGMDRGGRGAAEITDGSTCFNTCE